jgi:hypothetical protein
LNGAFAAQRANSIILIMCIHRGLSEEGRFGRKSWAASMRLSHKATFIFRSICLPGCIWGSTGGIKTCSMTEHKVLGPEGSETGMGGIGIGTGGRVMATMISMLRLRKGFKVHTCGWRGQPKRECQVTESSSHRLSDPSLFGLKLITTVQCEALIQ